MTTSARTAAIAQRAAVLREAVWPPTAPWWDRVAVAGLGIVALCAVWTVLSAIVGSHPEPNLHALQADAFLHGRWDLSRAVEDVARYRNHIYSPYPPAPALLLLPFVALFGTSGSIPIALAAVLSLASAFFAFRICRLAGLGDRDSILLTSGLLLGTAYWMSVTGSDSVWYFSHVVAVTALLAAIERAMSHHPIIAGSLVGVAFLSRQFTVVVVVFAIAIAVDGQSDGTARFRTAMGVAVPVMICAIGYAWFNAARFSGPFDTGYSSIALTGFLAERVQRHGLFDAAYVPFNFTYLFIQGFQVDFTGPGLLQTAGTSPFGTSLTFASPFLFVAVLARHSRAVITAAWCAIGVCVLGMLLYYNNGFAQQNAQRFSLDFIPVLFVLLAWAVSRTRTRLWQVAVAYAILLNFLALFVLAHTGPFERILGAR